VDPIASLSRVERRLLRVTRDRGLIPFVLLVTGISVALSLTITVVAISFADMTLVDLIVALAIAVAVPSLVAPAVAVFLGRLLIALGSASEELHHLARTDALTGVLNRRAFAEDAGALLARRGEGAALVVMVDVDDFKQVNDRNGHATGDRALCLLAENLSEAVRPHGVVGRLGGDEFAVIVAADAAEREVITGRLARACDLGGAVPALRASSGVLDITGAVPLDEALRRADHELYAAKRAASPALLTAV
jgi:diguanylate cyclase (GGDEF)-like protein